MAEEETKKKGRFKKNFGKKKDKEKKKNTFNEIKIAFRSLEDPQKYLKTILLPLVVLGVLLFLMPVVLGLLIPGPTSFNPITFVVGGVVLIILGLLYPYISWKGKEGEINGKMHFFITHLRVLAISDLSLKDIINVISKKKVYGSLGAEIKKISVLSTQWRTPIAKSFRFISDRTPSKILRDFLDRFSQSLVSGVEPREFIEHEQEAVLQEYKTMYESSIENITLINEIYVSLLISIMFVMAMGIVMPIIMGGSDMTTFIYLASFLLILAEGLLLYLLKAMIPADEMWHLSGEKGKVEKNIDRLFKIAVISSVVLGVVLFFIKYSLNLPFFKILSFEIISAIVLTPLLIPGFRVYQEEQNIIRKERNFLGFLPSLGSISAMRGGKITESVFYLSEKDYGILTKHIRDLYSRLRTRINDDAAWEWFGVDTSSNYIQRASEMFREATYAAANPRNVARMITENLRKIRDLRVKKLSIVKTSTSLLAGITFGIAFSIYISLIIGKHLNSIILTGMASRPFAGTNVEMGTMLNPVPADVFANVFLILFLVLVIHCFMMAITIKTLRGSHIMITLLYFVPFVWVVSLTATVVEILLSGMLSI